MEKSIRINKDIGESGFCSRREADQLIIDERVTVNGVLAGLGTRVSPGDKVRIDGEIVRLPESPSRQEETTAVRRKKKDTPNRSQREKIDYAARSSHRGTRGGVRHVRPSRSESEDAGKPAARKRPDGNRKSGK